MFRLNKRSRINYWSCSQCANLIRGTIKPGALTHEDWEKWRQEAKSKHPWRYWVAEEGLDMLQDFVNIPMDFYHTIEVYIRNRYIDKIQYLKTGLKLGEYYDLDHRILHGLFNELVIHVESELAHTMKAYPERRYKFVNGRCPQAGLDYLKWADQLVMDESYGYNIDDAEYGKPTAQAEIAKKTFRLYNWWKDRIYRSDPHYIYTKEAYGKDYYIKIGQVLDQYYEEDTRMLIELVKIRGDLWT